MKNTPTHELVFTSKEQVIKRFKSEVGNEVYELLKENNKDLLKLGITLFNNGGELPYPESDENLCKKYSNKLEEISKTIDKKEIKNIYNEVLNVEENKKIYDEILKIKEMVYDEELGKEVKNYKNINKKIDIIDNLTDEQKYDFYKYSFIEKNQSIGKLLILSNKVSYKNKIIENVIYDSFKEGLISMNILLTIYYEYFNREENNHESENNYRILYNLVEEYIDKQNNTDTLFEFIHKISQYSTDKTKKFDLFILINKKIDNYIKVNINNNEKLLSIFNKIINYKKEYTEELTIIRLITDSLKVRQYSTSGRCLNDFIDNGILYKTGKRKATKKDTLNEEYFYSTALSKIKGHYNSINTDINNNKDKDKNKDLNIGNFKDIKNNIEKFKVNPNYQIISEIQDSINYLAIEAIQRKIGNSAIESISNHENIIKSTSESNIYEEYLSGSRNRKGKVEKKIFQVAIGESLTLKEFELKYSKKEKTEINSENNEIKIPEFMDIDNILIKYGINVKELDSNLNIGEDGNNNGNIEELNNTNNGLVYDKIGPVIKLLVETEKNKFNKMVVKRTINKKYYIFELPVSDKTIILSNHYGYATYFFEGKINTADFKQKTLKEINNGRYKRVYYSENGDNNSLEKWLKRIGNNIK